MNKKIRSISISKNIDNKNSNKDIKNKINRAFNKDKPNNVDNVNIVNDNKKNNKKSIIGTILRLGQ